MDIASKQILLVLEYLVKPIQIGTNLALLQLMWVMVNGSFLPGRGAVHTALALSGLDQGSIKRSWRGLRQGVWSVEELLKQWQQWVECETQWQRSEHEGWQAVAIDITTFWRPKLKNWCVRGYHHLAGRLLPGVVLGVIVQVGHSQGQRLPLLQKLVRSAKDATDEERLHKSLLTWASKHLAEKDVAVLDAGFKLKAIQAAKVSRFIVRIATNATFRRNVLPEKKGCRGANPKYGLLVRPLARIYNGNLIEASPADVTVSFSHQGISIRAEGWHHLVRSSQQVDDQHSPVSVWVFHDPRYKSPLILATTLAATAAVIFKLYLDRWPVEQLPLAAKQMLGLQRMFVHAHASVWRLPELALLVGNVLTMMAAVLPPMPTGFWDTNPKKHLVGFDAHYSSLIFQI